MLWSWAIKSIHRLCVMLFMIFSIKRNIGNKHFVHHIYESTINFAFVYCFKGLVNSAKFFERMEGATNNFKVNGAPKVIMQYSLLQYRFNNNFCQHRIRDKAFILSFSMHLFYFLPVGLFVTIEFHLWSQENFGYSLLPVSIFFNNSHTFIFIAFNGVRFKRGNC